MDPADAVPSPRSGAQTPVDVCQLVPAAEVSELLGRRVSVVEAHYLSPTVPTYRCGLGTTFARANVTVSLAAGPVALAVFDEAYGEAAGGDPAPVENLGDRAYLRNEAGARSLVVLSRGAIVSLTASGNAAEAIRPRQLIALTRAAVQRLPANPALGVSPTGVPCTAVPVGEVEAALGAPVELATALVRPDGSVVCSWTGLPGSVTAMVHDSRADHAAAERRRRHGDGARVRGLDEGRAWSASDQPGDLEILVGATTVLRIQVIPAAGWASDDIATTKPEIRLANAIVAKLG
jgi:hypothetical protein